jgi:kinesin family protein 15
MLVDALLLMLDGQTGAGKTYTVVGPDGGGAQDEGLIPRVLRDLFRTIAGLQAQEAGDVSYNCKASICEIYQEQVRDLTATTTSSPRGKAANLQVRESLSRGVYVDGLTMHPIETAEDAVALLRAGLVRRQVAATNMNEVSSRSHSLFTLYVESVERCGGLTRSKHSRFNLIDLAGSERQKSTQTQGVRLKEASSINQSLSALGNVIKALVDICAGKSRHVHYRDSKLTFLLKDSLGGNSKTAIIANVSPDEASLGETLSTLKFAQRAKRIQNVARVNDEVLGQSQQQLREEIAQLKDALAKATTRWRRPRDNHQGGTRGPTSSNGDPAEREKKEAQEDERQETHGVPSLGSDKASLDRALGDALRREREMHQQLAWQRARLSELDELCQRLHTTKQSQALAIKLQQQCLARRRRQQSATGKATAATTTDMRAQLASLQVKADDSITQAVEWRSKCQILEDQIQQQQNEEPGSTTTEQPATFAWLGWSSKSLGWTGISMQQDAQREVRAIGEDMRRNIDNLAATVETLLVEKEALRQKMQAREFDMTLPPNTAPSSVLKPPPAPSTAATSSTTELAALRRRLSEQEARCEIECRRNQVLQERLNTEQARFAAERLATAAQQKGEEAKTIAMLRQQVEELTRRATDAETAQMASAEAAATQICALEEQNDGLEAKLTHVAEQCARHEAAKQTAEFALQSLQDEVKGLEAVSEAATLRADEMRAKLQDAEHARVAAEAHVTASFQQTCALQAEVSALEHAAAETQAAAEHAVSAAKDAESAAEVRRAVTACLADLTAQVACQAVNEEAQSWVMHMAHVIDDCREEAAQTQHKYTVAADQRLARLRSETAPLRMAAQNAMEDYDEIEAELDRVKAELATSEAALAEKSQGFDVLVARHAKLEEVILSAKKSREQQQRAAEQDTAKLLSALQGKLAVVEAAQEASLVAVREREMEVSQLRTASQSLEHLVRAKEATIAELKASSEEKEQSHKADKVALLRNLGTMKEALTALKQQFKKMKRENAEKEREEKEEEKKREKAERKADAENAAAKSSAAIKGKKKKTSRKTRLPLGVVPGNQAVVDICGGELSARLKLRRSRRLSGGTNNNKENGSMPASAKKARKILGALSDGKNTTY